MNHQADVKRYPGTLADLAEEIGDLRYDALAEFLRLLHAKLDRDASKDDGRGRARLAASLRAAAHPLGEAAAAMRHMPGGGT
jgi:hypothetical protein